MRKKASSVSIKASVLCVSLLAANSAFASKARVNALQGALGLVDTQTIFEQPAYVNKLDPHAAFEFGDDSLNPPGGAARAEGGILLNNGGRMGLYLGHVSESQSKFREQAGTFQLQDNPVDFFYGSGDWGASLSVSNSEDQTTAVDTARKQSAVIARFGYLLGTHELSLSVDALGSAETTTAGVTNKVTMKTPVVKVGWLNTMDDIVLNAGASFGTADQDIAGTKKELKDTTATVGVNHRPFEGVYYGIAVDYAEFDVGGQKDNRTLLPVVIGLEKNMTSWLVLRGSVKQNLLFGSKKNETLADPLNKEQKNVHNTTVKAGTGLKYANFTFDGLLGAETSGKVDSSNFMTEASLSYTF